MYFNLYLQYISGRLSAILPIFSYLKEYQLYLPVFYLKDYLLNVLHILVYADLEDYPLENLKALPLFPSNRRKLQVYVQYSIRRSTFHYRFSYVWAILSQR